MITKLLTVARKPWVLRTINVAIFYIGWTICILGGAVGGVGLVIAATAAFLVLHLAIIERRRQEIILIAAIVAMGAVIETGYLLGRVLEYASPSQLAPWLAPIWILCAYAIFATSLNYCLVWMKERLTLSAVFGSVGGAMCYLAGHKMGGCQFLIPIPQAMGIIAAVWLVFMPITLRLAIFLDTKL